jgi:hypothetical protein
MAHLASAGYPTTRGHGLDVAPLKAKDRLGRLDRAAFGGGHAAALPAAGSRSGFNFLDRYDPDRYDPSGYDP